MAALKGDFIGFQYGDYHSSDLEIMRVSDGSRYLEELTPTISDKIIEKSGNDGTYFFNSYYTQKPFDISFAFDNITEEQKRKLSQVFSNKRPQKLIFDEAPYKYYLVKSSAAPQLQYICFEQNGQRIYKGEGTLQLLAYHPYAYSLYKWLDEYTIDSVVCWDDEWNNKNEWAAASNLKLTQGNYDKIVFSNETTASIPLFNAGDLETAFTLSFSFDNNNIGSDLIHIYLEGNADSQLYLSKMTKKGNDTEVRLNTDNNLLEGYENGVRSGNLYNEFKVSGNFFKIPIGDSTLKIIGCSSNNNITIKYNYLYY